MEHLDSRSYRSRYHIHCTEIAQRPNHKSFNQTKRRYRHETLVTNCFSSNFTSMEVFCC